MLFGEKAPPLWEAGISVIPCAGKRPVIKGWQQYCEQQAEPSLMGAWESIYSDCNIGMACGRASGIVVLDIDDPSLIEALPQSPVSWRGREGRESRAFKWSGETVEHYLGIDIIGTGGQVILPPSIHPITGQPYVWLNNALPYEDLPELPKARPSILYRDKATPVVVNGQVQAVKPGRWTAMGSISFKMACDGFSKGKISEGLLECAHNSWFSDITEKHRGQNHQFEADKISSTAIDKAILQNKRQHQDGDDTVIDLSELMAVKVHQRDPCSAEAFVPPPLPKEGALRWIYEYIEQQSSPQIPSLAMGGAIAIMSALLQNRFKCGRIGLNTYVLNIAPSGTGKSYPYTAVEKIVPLPLLGAGGYKSGKVFTQGLGKQRERLDLLDEVSAMFAHMRDGSSFQTEMVDIICGMWSAGPTSYFRLSQSSSGLKEGERAGVWSPAVSMLASTTDSGLLSSISRTMTEKGFFPRFMIFPQPMLDWKEELSTEDYLGPILRWRDMIFERYPILVAGATNGPNNVQNSYTEASDAQRLARDVQPFDRNFLAEMSKRYFLARKLEEADESFDAFQARKIEQVVKIALMYELGRMTDPCATEIVLIDDGNGKTHEEAYASEDFTIQADAFEYAEKLWDWMFVSQRLFISNLAESSDRIRQMKQIYKYIADAKQFGVSHAMFTKRFARVPRRERDEIISDLIVSEQIKVLQVGSLVGGNRKVYVSM